MSTPSSRLHPAQWPHGVTDSDVEMMDRAMELARDAARAGEVPVGAIVYRDHEVLGSGCNRRERDHDPTAHAEICALAEAGRTLGGWRLAGCSMVVTLEPCAMCAGAMVNARLARVIYGATDPKAGGCESVFDIPGESRLNHRVEVIRGLRADACGQLLSDFFHARRMEHRDTMHA